VRRDSKLTSKSPDMSNVHGDRCSSPSPCMTKCGIASRNYSEQLPVHVFSSPELLSRNYNYATCASGVAYCFDVLSLDDVLLKFCRYLPCSGSTKCSIESLTWATYFYSSIPYSMALTFMGGSFDRAMLSSNERDEQHWCSKGPHQDELLMVNVVIGEQ